MGVTKRIAGWRQAAWPIPGPLQALVGLIPYRDPEAYLEARRAAREAARERMAIQEDGKARVVRRKRHETPDDHEPARAALGWYRIGATFYPIGAGPMPEGLPVDSCQLSEKTDRTTDNRRPQVDKQPTTAKMHQGLLF